MEYWLAWFHEVNEQVKEVAIAAEQMGFGGIAVSDHIAMPKAYKSVHPSGRRVMEHDTLFPACLITIATMAAVTSRLRFMSYAYVLPMREPFSVAKEAATLAMQCGYRFLLGAGSGWNVEEMQLLGYDPARRGRRMDEMIAIIRDFWDDGLAAFDGEFYRFETAGQFPVPTQRIPILIGGKSDVALRRAARNDGWCGMNYAVEEIPTLVATLKRERHRHLQSTGGDPTAPFPLYVMPDAPPSHDVYGRLRDCGIDGAVAMVWPFGDPRCATLEGKLEAMHAFADTYIKT